ncbi:MAG: PQQ-binding-like beta-propeller repeat protein [Planctomycetota bacterium]
MSNANPSNDDDSPDSSSREESPTGYESPPASTASSGSEQAALRWWPAAVLLGLMAAAKLIPMLFESPPLPVMMVGFMGPAAIGSLLVAWWLMASRASIPEKAAGLVGILAIGFVTVMLLHPSMKGMGVAIHQVPTGMVAFALPLIALARKPSVRLAAALVLAALGFGFWDAVQMHGVTGKFAAEFDWRWAPTAEDEYLASLAEEASSEEPVVESPTDRDADMGSDSMLVSRQTADWSDFRGPNRDNQVPGIVLATDWSEQPPEQIWKRLIGPGWSSFTVAAGRLYTQEQRGEEEAIVCLDANSGANLWTHTYPGRFWEAIAGAGPRATPTIGEGIVIALGADGQLTALDAIDGSVRWQRSLREDARREPPTWGWSSSPLIVGKTVLVHAGGEDGLGVIAYQIADGEIAWSRASGNHTYSSPQAATFSGTTGVLMMTNDGVQFLDSKDGTELWLHESPADNYRSIQPLVLADGVLMATPLGGGTVRVDVNLADGTWSTEERWMSRSIKPDFNDYVVYENNLYGFDGNIFASIDLETGDRNWKRGRYGNGQVLMLPEAGQLLVLSEQGELMVLDATPEGLEELARFEALDGKTWNHPVLIGNRVYVRNPKEAACYELPVTSD